MKKRKKHKTTVRTGLPQATWRLFNAGVPVSPPEKLSLKEKDKLITDLRAKINRLNTELEWVKEICTNLSRGNVS